MLENLDMSVLREAIDNAPPKEKAKLLELVDELNIRKTRALAQEDFLEYVKAVWPDFISGSHHRRIAKIFEAVARGEKKRVIINLGPRHTKSEFASYLLPSWILGKFPKKKVMQISNTAELAEGFGRKVRNLVDSNEYKNIFPEVELRTDSKAAGRWNTNYNGEYFASGVGGTVTGRGADLLIIDDPHSEGEAVLAQFNPAIYDKVFEWYTSGPRQRLQPGGAIIIVMCMTGDTPVLMASGEEKPLRDVRPGDIVATFDNGRLTTSRVNNHQSSGVDSIYKIQTQSGRILRANERHPFLIMNEGVLEWTRLRNLRRGDQLVSLKDVTVQHEQKPEQFEGFCAMTAILQSDTARRQLYLNELQRTSDFTTDQILAITPDGEEEVFDVEIDRTENFIANGVVSHNTRWSLRDLTGQVLDSSSSKGGDKWEVIEFPAILPSGKPLWPEFWSYKELSAIRAELPNAKWMAQYQQEPTSEQSAIIKREWWQEWPKEDPPKVSFVIMAMDTAFEKKTSADYSAAVIFGVFENEEDGDQPNLILLNSWRDRLEFPELKAKTLELYEEWEPDAVIIEKKASGAPLIYELRRMGVPAQEFTPSKGNDKITRLNAIADIFASGKVWAPHKRWADELIDEVAAFPAGKNDDLVDCVSLALARFRSGGFIGTAKDKDMDEDNWMLKARRAAYY